MAKRRYLSNLSEEFSGYHRQRYRRPARRHRPPRLSAKLGVDAIWLTPFYVSPQVDNGYDVANYTAIDPSYGTMADFDALVAEAKARGIRIVLDMVLNHTSTEHEWFRQSLNKESPYRQFYIWRDGEPDALPNNWRSKFGGNAWQWHADSGQYYLHLFAIEQADLNWENPAVRAELKKVCEFWADRGVDGLRLDVVNLISKDQTFPAIWTGMAAASIPTARGCMSSCRR